MIPVLESERLILRELVPTDAMDIFTFRSDPIEQRHNDAPLQDVEQASALIDWLAREHRDNGAMGWGLTVKPSDSVVGLLGFNYWNTPHRRAGVGYDLSRRLWGHGLASEAMRAMLNHGFGPMGLNRVEAHTEIENVASVRMLLRLGFWQEGAFHEYFLDDDGGHRDVGLFVLLRKDRSQPLT